MSQKTIRMIIVTLAASSLLAFVPAAPAEAHHLPSTYCDQDGDLCQGAGKVMGAYRLQIRTYHRYFRRYKLCVWAPDGSVVCKRFQMDMQDGGSPISSIRWRRHFPDEGLGAYSVTWRVGGTRIGKKLGFHVR